MTTYLANAFSPSMLTLLPLDVKFSPVNEQELNEVLEILLDAKRLTDLLSQELNNYIVRVTKG